MTLSRRIHQARRKVAERRHRIGAAIHHEHYGHSAALGIIFAGLCAGFIVERRGVRSTLGGLVSLNHLLHMVLPGLSPALDWWRAVSKGNNSAPAE